MDPSGTDVVPPAGTTEPFSGDRFRDVPPSLRPSQRQSRWPFVILGVFVAALLAVLVAWPINLPYYALSPGPTSDVGDFVEIEGSNFEDSGELLFLTVSLKEVNALEAVWGWLDPEVELTRRENIRPVGVSQEELRRQNLDAMDSSKETAIFVALTQLGMNVTFSAEGAQISAVIDGGASIGVLQANDVIVGINGAPVEFATDAIAALSGRPPGETVTLDVRRPTDESATEFEDFTVEIVLGVFRSLDEDGNEVVDEDRGVVGVFLGDFNRETVLPVDVVIDSENIGGPSAGMMFTLEIINQLTDTDLTSGEIIAGTGTIARDGMVGPIGGVRQKVFAAIDAGATLILVPEGNFADARDAAGDDAQVVSIATIEDALAALEPL